MPVTDDGVLSLALPAVCRKQVTAAVERGRLSSNDRVAMSREAARRLGRARLRAAIPSWAAIARVTTAAYEVARQRWEHGRRAGT